MSEAMAAAAASRSGFVKDVLTHQYPRLAALLDQTLKRILGDTQVGCPPGPPWHRPCKF